MPEKHTSSKAKGLGRGLGSLLQAASEPVSAAPIRQQQPDSPSLNTQQAQEHDKNRVHWISIEKIKGNKNQPRKTFVKEELQELADSIKSRGILQPITALKLENGTFQIIAGERRWRAAQLAGLHQVPVILRDSSEKEALELALIENIQRSNLNVVEEGEAYLHLMEKHDLTQQQLAEIVGKDRVTISHAIRVLSLPVKVRELIKEKKLSLGHAKVLLSLESAEDQLLWAQRCIKLQLSVRALEKQLKANSKKGLSEKESSIAQVVKAHQEELQKALGRKVKIQYRAGKGTISLSFYSEAEYADLLQNLKLL